MIVICLFINADMGMAWWCGLLSLITSSLIFDYILFFYSIFRQSNRNSVPQMWWFTLKVFSRVQYCHVQCTKLQTLPWYLDIFPIVIHVCHLQMIRILYTYEYTFYEYLYPFYTSWSRKRVRDNQKKKIKYVALYSFIFFCIEIGYKHREKDYKIQNRTFCSGLHEKIL